MVKELQSLEMKTTAKNERLYKKASWRRHNYVQVQTLDHKQYFFQ